MYPTSHNTVLNFVVIHPEIEVAADAGDRDAWDQQGNLDKMLRIFSGFDHVVVRLLGRADPQSIKVWKLLDMDSLPHWHHRRLALLGDAAHPFLPHQGQGAGVAIEDAISLAVVLPRGTPADEAPERLKLYHDIRHDRATRIQGFSRIVGEDCTDDKKLDIYSFTNFNFGHDEWDHSTQRLREWSWSRMPASNAYWRMPVAFGPMPGPRQTHLGAPRDGTASTFTQTTLGNMAWLAGRGYNLLGLYVHGVEYVRDDGSAVRASYLPVLFESLADPIVSGREELGMPKLYASVDVYRSDTSAYHVRAGWEGALWGDFLLEDLVEVDPETEADADAGILSYKYLPKSGRRNRGIAAEEYPVFEPFSSARPTPRPHKVYATQKARIEVDPLGWEQLPTLYHVISRLAEVPVYDIVGAKVVEGEGVPDVSGAGPIQPSSI